MDAPRTLVKNHKMMKPIFDIIFYKKKWGKALHIKCFSK